MRHLRSFKKLNEAKDEYFNILDIKEGLESLESQSESYFTINMDDHHPDLDYDENDKELKITTEISEDPSDYYIEMDKDQISTDLFRQIDTSEETPLFTLSEILKAIDDAIDNNDGGRGFVKSIYTGGCTIDWNVDRGRFTSREFRVTAEIKGKPEVNVVEWDDFVDSVMKELGSRAAGRITYS
jgi:hypothetical protein